MKDIKYIDLEELIIKAQRGEEAALEELVRREQKNVYAALYYLNPNSEDILDLTQDVLVKMVKNIHALRNPKYFKGWLNQIVANRFFDEMRKKRRKFQTVPMEADDSFTKVPDFRPIPDEKTLKNELDEVIKESIHKLPEPFRMAIIMRELIGLSYDEIARVTNSSIGTVKSRIARARNKLQEYIKPYIN